MNDSLTPEPTYQTLVIWSDFQDFPRFYLVPGDLRRLDGLIINCGIDWQPLLDMTYGPAGNEPFKWATYKTNIKECGCHSWDFTIQCGEMF